MRCWEKLKVRLNNMKEKLTGRRLVDALKVQSRINLSPHLSDAGELLGVYLEIEGPLAALPNMKNNKMPGFNFIAPDKIAKLKALTELFNETWSMFSQKPLKFYNTKLLLVVIAGKRKVSFDLDGVAVTVRDWLEPSAKEKGGKRKVRGWGVGLVDDDRHITSVVVHANFMGSDTETTRICVCPLETVREPMMAVIAKAIAA
jgi:hypothetical protein